MFRRQGPGAPLQMGRREHTGRGGTAAELELLRGVLKGLRPSDLARSFYIRQDRRWITIREMLLQMTEGVLQHKSELNALLCQMDVEPTRVDFSWTGGFYRATGVRTFESRRSAGERVAASCRAISPVGLG